MTAYADELRSQARSILADHPDMPHHWRNDGLVFSGSDLDGFEVTLQPDGQGIVVLTGVGLHEHVEGAPAEAVRDALGLVRDLLSPDMRVRELRAGGRAYRWLLERRELDRWTCESQTGLLFWNYFARRSERVYQNRWLPGRLASAPSPQASGA